MASSARKCSATAPYSGTTKSMEDSELSTIEGKTGIFDT